MFDIVGELRDQKRNKYEAASHLDRNADSKGEVCIPTKYPIRLVPKHEATKSKSTTPWMGC